MHVTQPKRCVPSRNCLARVSESVSQCHRVVSDKSCERVSQWSVRECQSVSQSRVRQCHSGVSERVLESVALECTRMSESFTVRHVCAIAPHALTTLSHFLIHHIHPHIPIHVYIFFCAYTVTQQFTYIHTYIHAYMRTCKMHASCKNDKHTTYTWH